MMPVRLPALPVFYIQQLLNINTPLSGTSIENFPCASVCTATLLPLTDTVTPARGVPPASLTTPVIGAVLS